MCRIRLLGLVLVAWSTFAVGCGKQAGGSKYDSPEAVFKVFQDSAKNDDWRTAAGCLTEQSQTTMCDTLILGASFSTMGEPQKEKDLAQLLKGHGIDMAADSEPPAAGPPGGGMGSIAKSAKDKPALIGELLAWLKKNSNGSGPDFRVQELGKVAVDGDHATATVETGRGKRPIEFHRIDGGWLISMPEGGPPPGAAGGGPDFKPFPTEPAGPNDKQEPVDTTGLNVDQNAGHGTLWIRDKAHELKYAVAYRTKSFDEPCTAVLLTAKPIDMRKLGELKTVLEREGNDLGFFLFDVSLRLLIDDKGEPQYLFAWADNVSINRNSDIDAKVTQHDGRISGKVSSKSTDAKDDDFKFRFEAEFDAPLLPIKVPATKADASVKPEPEVESRSTGDEPKPNVAATEQPATTPPAEIEQPTATPPAEATTNVNEPLPEPATVEQAAKLLDLRTFPVVEGAQFLTGRTHVGQLLYTAKIDVPAALAFLKEHMKERGWTEVENAKTHQGAAFKHEGFLVSLSVSEYGDQPETKGLAMISIQNHGNVPVDKLPVPPGAAKEYSLPSGTMYVTTAPVEETKQKCHKLLLDLGWKPYGRAGNTFDFKRNAIKLSVNVGSRGTQPAQTYIDYSSELLSADIPVPPGVDDPRYDDFQKILSFDQAGNTVEKVVGFYNDELAAQGFKPTTKPIGEKEVAVVYRNDQKDIVFLDMTLYKDLTRVRVRHLTAAEIAESDRLHKEELAKQEQERQRREAAKPKIALPIPGKAKQVTQKNDENLEIVLARGAGTPVLEAYRKYFRDAGWSEDDVDIRDGSGSMKFTKEESSLRFHLMEIIERGELVISGNYVVLQPNKDAPDFASLGGLPAAEPIDTAELAKVPADLPIPADARKLTVRSGKNVAFEVAGDVKTLAEYFRTTMVQHGWTYDSTFSIISDTTASISFKKGKKPCGISLTNVFGGDLTSVTIAGGGMDWTRLRGANAAADPAVANAAWRKKPAEAPKTKDAPKTTKTRPAAPTSRSR